MLIAGKPCSRKKDNAGRVIAFENRETPSDISEQPVVAAIGRLTGASGHIQLFETALEVKSR